MQLTNKLNYIIKCRNSKKVKINNMFPLHKRDYITVKHTLCHIVVICDRLTL